MKIIINIRIIKYHFKMYLIFDFEHNMFGPHKRLERDAARRVAVLDYDNYFWIKTNMILRHYAMSYTF